MSRRSVSPLFALFLCGCVFDTRGRDPLSDHTVGLDRPDSTTGLDRPLLERPLHDLSDGSPPDHPRPADHRPADLARDASPCVTPCPLGCFAAMKRCHRLAPSNADVTAFHDQLAQGVTASGKLLFNGATGAVSNGATIVRPAGSVGTVQNGIYFGVVQQGAGYPELAVFGLSSLAVPAGQALGVEGARALVVYVAGDVTLEGTVTAAPGTAGGFAGGSSGDAPACFGGEGRRGGLSGNEEGGGGGGGRKAAGGAGGADTSGTPGGNGGAANGAATLVPLYGGCGGGHGGHSCGGSGGAGGGALQLSAGGTLSVSGVLSVPGAGGGDGESGTYSCSGGGGGSGGAILLEAAVLNLASSAVLAANGGGGGGYAAGAAGGASTANAQGGASNGKTGAGGLGGAMSPEAGADGQPGTAGGGGGGGSVGLIRLSSPALKLQSSSLSPAPATSTTVSVW
ncbi:MAG: hypothetical protein ACOY3Y_00985 [Acidobacteriota bacterium]